MAKNKKERLQSKPALDFGLPGWRYAIKHFGVDSKPLDDKEPDEKSNESLFYLNQIIEGQNCYLRTSKRPEKTLGGGINKSMPIDENVDSIYSKNSSLEELISGPIYPEKNVLISPKYIFTKKISSSFPFLYNSINKNYLFGVVGISQLMFPQQPTLQAGIAFHPRTDITHRTIGRFVQPLVEYVRQEQPDYIVACDRGGRLIGVALFMLYRQLYGRLPTVDGTVRFRRISKSESEEDTCKHLRPLVQEMLACKPNAKVLVLDDWIYQGTTKSMTYKLLNELGRGALDIKFGVLVGSGADVTGTYGRPGVDWHDTPAIIGVDYQGFNAVVERDDFPRKYRRMMSESIGQLAMEIKAGMAAPAEELIPNFMRQPEGEGGLA